MLRKEREILDAEVRRKKEAQERQAAILEQRKQEDEERKKRRERFLQINNMPKHSAQQLLKKVIDK